MDRFGSEFGEHFRQYLRAEVTVPHTMFFAHLGAPETIRIRKESRPTYDEASPAFAYWQMRASGDASPSDIPRTRTAKGTQGKKRS